jgi:DNA-binding NarL/FixJ family response regulator
MSIRVLIVDDQSLVRAGFRLVLENDPEIEVVGEASNGHEAVYSAGRLEPDVVLMDIRMPELDGISATREITARHPARVLVLTTTSTSTSTTRCRRGPAASCSRTRRQPSSSKGSARSPAVRRCSPRR